MRIFLLPAVQLSGTSALTNCSSPHVCVRAHARTQDLPQLMGFTAVTYGRDLARGFYSTLGNKLAALLYRSKVRACQKSVPALLAHTRARSGLCADVLSCRSASGSALPCARP